MMKNYLLINIFFALFFVGCGKEQRNYKLSITIGGISSGLQSTYPGGVMLYGVNSSRNEKFSVQLVDIDSYTFSSSAGESWSFYAYGWSGPGVMEGDLHCSLVSNKILENTGNIIDLTLNINECFGLNHLPQYGWNEYSNPWSVNPVYFSLCLAGTDAGNLASCSGLGSYATGVEVILGTHDQRKFGNNSGDVDSLKSSCIALTNGGQSLSPLKIPSPENNTSFPMSLKFNVYYGPSGCSGSACCTGRKENHFFDRGYKNTQLGQYAYSSSLKVIEKGTNPKFAFDTSSFNGPVNKGCYPMKVDLKNNSNLLVSSATNQTLLLSCGTSCMFYSDNICSVGMTSSISVTITSGTTSTAVFYIRPLEAVMKLSSSGNGEFSAEVPQKFIVKSTLANMSRAYLGSIVNNYLDFNTSFPSTMFDGTTDFVIPGTVYAFRSNISNDMGCTGVGCDTYKNYGMFIVNSFSSGSSTMNFDFKTFDSADNVLQSGVNISWTYGTGPQCLDFELANPVTSYVPYEGDACAQTNMPPNQWFFVQGNYSGSGGSLIEIPVSMIIQ